LGRASRCDEARARVVESWLEEFGADVWALLQLYLGTDMPPVSIYEQVFTWALRNFPATRRFPSVRDALVYQAIVQCESESADEMPSVPVGDSAAEDAAASESGPTAAELFGDATEGMRRLSGWPKMAAFGYLFSDGDLNHLAETLLRPKRYILQQLDEATRVVWTEHVEDADGLTKWETLRERVQEFRSQVVVPAAVQVRSRKVLLASLAAMHAERRHQGPRWLKYGMVSLAALSAGAIAFGVTRNNTPPVVSVSAPRPQVSSLPKPLGNFQGAIVAQFALPQDIRNLSLDHLVLTKDAVYLPELKLATDTWPSILVKKCEMKKSGEALLDNLKTVAEVDLIPPVRPAGSAKRTIDTTSWEIKDWQFYVTGPWGVAAVRWAFSDHSAESITQLYAVYLPTGKSGLVKVFDAKTPDEATVVAVGDGKVVIQSSVDSGGEQSGTHASLSLPIDVYTLSGNVPLKALGEAKHIPAPFGLMQKPVITGGTLVFQGVQGQPEREDSNATWYALSWDGQLSRYVGPPVDGQPHWAVKGTSGTIWWAETTPADSKPDSVQVLMSPCGVDGEVSQTPATTLSEPVKFFTASNEYVAWVQDTDNTTQLVVGALR
jgi:hypothetical protein